METKIPFVLKEYDLYCARAVELDPSVEATILDWYKNWVGGVSVTNTVSKQFQSYKEKDPDFLVFYLKNKQGEVIASRNMSSFLGVNELEDMKGILASEKIVRTMTLYVLPEYRSKGISVALVAAVNNYIFGELGYEYIVSFSRHVNALRLYQQCGATVLMGDINTLNSFCSDSENQEFYREFTTNKAFKHWKFDRLIRFYFSKAA